METSARHPSKASSRSRPNVSGLPGSQPNAHLETLNAAPLMDRLHLNWQSLPKRQEAKLYTSSATQVPYGGTNRVLGPAKVSSKQPSFSFEHFTSAGLSTRKRSQTISASLAAFEKKYAAEDVMMRYVLHVIRTGSSVRRSDIPRGKSFQRKVRPEEDVLYLVHCETPPCGFRNVYWLTFADGGAILRSDHASSLEYFTLGSHGFTQFKGGQGIEFSDVATWVDEKRAFDQMTNMKGLKRIQQMIFFFSWKRQAVQRRLHRVQERLACSLFTCHPIAARLLMSVRDVCGEIEREAEIEYIKDGTSYSLESLAHIHRDRAHAAKTAIATKIHGLCITIDEATRNISRYKEGSSFAITDQEAFSKSLRISSLRERMFTFLRLVDVHVAEAVYGHMTGVIQDFQVRMCGKAVEKTVASAVDPREQSGHACQSEPAEVVSKGLPPAQVYQPVNYRIYTFESGASVVAFPGLYVRLQEDVDFDGDVNSTTMTFAPTKVQVLELVHTILLNYCVSLDGLPRVLTDKHFEHVLTPFVPIVKKDFAKSMLKPSHIVLGSHELELREMRAALEMHYRRIGIIQQEHLRCVRAIKIAERESQIESTKISATTDLDDSEEEDDRLPDLPDLSSSAAAYELSQKTWGRFLQYANSASSMVQVGYLLLDQRSLVEKLRVHVSKHVAEMDNALPSIYQQFLVRLLEDVDGRIEKVTKIPTNLAEANTWLAQVTSMMSTHPFRQRLDLKIANLARLRVLIKERGLISLDPEVQDTIRKLELTWESVIETLFMCLARVEERGSEHRRSVQDVISKVDEYINGQMQLILKTFVELPSGSEEGKEDGYELRSSTTSKDHGSKREGMVQQLEDLVEMDIERKNVVQQFEEYDREDRAITDISALQQGVWAPSRSENASTMALTDKLPSELLLLYILTSLELREWYESWKKLRDKWLGSPLTGVHPGTMINRIKQFRRRLGNASSRLTRLSSVLLQMFPLDSTGQNESYGQGHEEETRKTSPSFTKKEFELMRVFDESIEEMLNCNRIFQAITGGTFSEARWAAMHQLLNVQSGSNGLTLRLMKEKCGAQQIEEFLEVCDECIVEAKLHLKMEQARQRLARIELGVEETNYSVRCEGVPEALTQLDDIAVDLKLCLFGQNPELQLCLELRDDLDRKTMVCTHILTYQKDWRLRCEATKLHEVDEFFSKRFSGGGDFAIPRSRRPQQKSGLKQDQTVWQAFLDASYAWSDRLRRLFFVNPRQAQTAQANRIKSLGKKAPPSESASPPPLRRQTSIPTKTMECTLDDVMESFKGFEFEANFAACERGMELVRTYLNSLREKSPRMYCLDEEMMLRLLLRDSDIQQLHQSLAICFPRVHRFAISRVANRIGSTVETYGKQESTPLTAARSTKNDGTIVIVGPEGVQGDVAEWQQCVRFRLPVAKIGRVKFWFTRLEEEMSSMVLYDLKRALEWVPNDCGSSVSNECDTLLLQSIVTASGLRFTFEMNCALRDIENQAKLQQLQLMVNEKLGGLASTRRTDKTASSSIRIENMILLNAMQLEITRHVGELLKHGQHEDALFFWSMQFQIRAFVETISTPSTITQPTPGKHGRLERSELFPTSFDSMKVPVPNHNGQSISMSVLCQVAHLQLPMGQEFVGFGRLPILSPFTQRCSYALFTALRMHHTALVVPYSSHQQRTDPTSLVWGLGQLLMRPCIEFSCSSSAGVTTIHHLCNLLSAVSRLGGFLIVRHLLQLSAPLIGAVQQQMLQHFHQAATVGSHGAHHQQAVVNSLVLPRQYGGTSAIFTPLNSREDLHSSGLIQSIRSHFRAVAVTHPAIQFIIECFLISDGYTVDQIKELKVIQAFEGISALDDCSFSVDVLVLRVVEEARRLRKFYRVVWDSNPLMADRTATTLSQKGMTNSESSGQMDICEGQCFFRHAFISSINLVSMEEQASRQRVILLLMRTFPLSEGGKLVTKSKGGEEAVAAAVTIYLESSYALPAACEQFELIMELWRALQTFPAALVCGPCGSGKSTCITALHRALAALELSERNQENDEVDGRNSQGKPQASFAQLVILNPQLLTLGQLYNTIAAACGSENSRKTEDLGKLKWVLIDGEVDGAVLDRLLDGDNRACSSPSTLPSSSILYRGQRSSILSGDCMDQDNSPRLLFEVTSIISLSPSALAKCWSLYIHTHCINVASIIGAWRARWQKQLVFPPESRGAEAMDIVFKAVDVLISSICVRFVMEEAIGGPVGEVLETANLRLGCLSMNHMTVTALKLVSLCCFHNKSLLQELSYLKLVELVVFSVLWGFAGHLPDPFKLKMENYVRVKSKEYSETKHLAELPHGLMDANNFTDVWDELQSRSASSLTPQSTNEVNRDAKPETNIHSSFDALSGQVLVLVPAATSLIRICTLLLHSSHSFLLIGPAASGKTSLLRWITNRNREAEIYEMKIETSLDDRHVHGILDWMDMPAAWFPPLNESDSAESSRAKVREEAELFAGRAKHAFVFLDNLDAGGEIANMAQVEFVRTMLDHRLGYSTKRAGFQIVEKQVGAGMRLDDSESGQLHPSCTLARFMRHFSVLRVPTYSQKELQSVFRAKYQQYFRMEISRVNTERRLSTKGVMGGGQQLPLEEVILRASVAFAVELVSFQQLGNPDHPSFILFNLHHVNMLLERTLAFASGVSTSRRNQEGTTLVMLGKAHQSWLSELQNMFLSNYPAEGSTATPPVPKPSGSVEDRQEKRALSNEGDNTQKKISSLLRHLSEKYFSVALGGNGDHRIPISVEALHFLVKLAEHHVQAPLLQPRLTQLRELLNEHMTAANGMSRRSSDQARRDSSGSNVTSSPVELVSSVLLEIAAASSSSDAMNGGGTNVCSKTSRPYCPGQLTAVEMKLLLSNSWCLTQTTHLVHALSQQQLLVISSTAKCSRLLSDRLLRFACDLHGFKVHLIEDQGDNVEVMAEQHKNVLRVVLGAAGVRQERVALWVRRHQLLVKDKSETNYLAHFVQELCLGNFPSLALLPGAEELREELLLSCIQSRKQLEIVTESELMTEFQQRLHENLRLCIIEERDSSESSREGEMVRNLPERVFSLIRWVKSRPSCHWRRISVTQTDLLRMIPEMATAALTSPALCGLDWDFSQTAKYVVLCHKVHLHMMNASSVDVGSVSQLDNFLSLLTNLTVSYGTKLQHRQQRMKRLETSLETLVFARDNVMPALERMQQKFELQITQIDGELEIVLQEIPLEKYPFAREENKTVDDEQLLPEEEETRWALHSRYEELMLMNSETKRRLDEVKRYIAEWHHVTDRMGELFTKWTHELDQEKLKTDNELLAAAVFVSAQRAYTHVTALAEEKRKDCLQILYELVVENTTSDSSANEMLVNGHTDVDTLDGSVEITKLIWTSRFPLLHNPEIYRDIRLIDDLCDRVPVVVDPSGVLQRFLVHVFSGHTLFSTFPGCGTAGEVESETPSASKLSTVISFDDPKFESQLQEAQRLAVPVLLVNFRSTDHDLLNRLQPFLNHNRFSHSPPRRPILRELTMKYYEDQRQQKQRRTSNASSAMAAMSSLAQTAATVGGGVEVMARQAIKHRLSVINKTVAGDSLSPTANDLGKLLDRHNARSRNAANNGNNSSLRCFQIYAVTALPIPPSLQHDLVSQFAHFCVSVPDAELKSLLQISRIEKSQPKQLQELRGEQIWLADCWVKMLQSRDQLCQGLVALKPDIIRDESPFASRITNTTITIQLLERYSELATQFTNEHQAEIIWSSREKILNDKYGELGHAIEVFAPMATRLVGIAKCMTAMSSLSLGNRKSPFYLQNVRYVENAAAQQLAVQGGDATELSLRGINAIMNRVGAGFISESHYHVFSLLESLQQQVQLVKSSTSDGPFSAWKKAVVWLVTSSTHKAGLNATTSLDLMDNSAEMCQGIGVRPGHQNSLKRPGGAGTSLVERLRRRVKFCAYLSNGWNAPSGTNNVRVKQRKPSRPLPDASNSVSVQLPSVNIANFDSDPGIFESTEVAVEKLQRMLDSLLSTSETIWYEWKTSRLQLQLDAERMFNNLEDQTLATSSSGEQSNTTFPSPIVLIGMEDMLVRFQLEKLKSIPGDEAGLWRQSFVPVLVAKALFPAYFAQTLCHYLRKHGCHENPLPTLSEHKQHARIRESYTRKIEEMWTAWPSPASLVVDITPSRGKHSRAHLPRALIFYMPHERSNVGLQLSSWDIAVFIETETESDSLREELTMLITTKHRFVLEVLHAQHAEAAVTLISQITNEHALLSVPEWYLLASFAVASAIENGKLTVMDRIAVVSSTKQRHLNFVERDGGHIRSVKQTIKHKLVDECGALESSAAAMIQSVVRKQAHNAEVEDPTIRDLGDLIVHNLSIEEVSAGNVEREQMTRHLIRLLNETSNHDSSSIAGKTAKRDAMLSSELLSDLLCVGSYSFALLDEPGDDWLPRCSSSGGEAACEQLGKSLSQVRDLFEELQATSRLGSEQSIDATTTRFFPWQSFEIELTKQFTAFEAIHKSIRSLSKTSSNYQQQLSSLARGYLPFEWTETYFEGTAWPSQSSGTVSVAQILLLMAYRVGVLIRCVRGDRAWALNLAVVSDTCEFLRCLRAYTASRSGLSESSLVLVLELDASAEATDTSTATNEKEGKTKKALAIAKQLVSGFTLETDWHGAVLHRIDNGVESWGIRVEGLVLIQQSSSTKLYPLLMCRITCRSSVTTASQVEAPLVLLPSMSPYQPAPTLSQESGVRLVLGRSINSVIDIRDNSKTNETTQFGVGVTVFPDDDSNEGS